MKSSPVALALLLLVMALRAPAGDVLQAADRIAAQHLPFLYGSADLREGGLDCSGFVRLAFHEGCGIELPHEADQQLLYCQQRGQVWDATSHWTPALLQPGDLIFFAGPEDSTRISQVTHVMIWCGGHIMVGAESQGRRTDGSVGGVGYYPLADHPPCGVMGESGARFIGHRCIFAYARLPGAMPPGQHALPGVD